MKNKFYYYYIIIICLFILHLTMYSPRGAFGVFIKPMTAEFDWPRALIAGAFSLSSIVQGFSGIMMGWLNDRWGPRIVLSVCGILLGSGLMLMYYIDSAWQLYLFYIVPIGIGTGGIYAPQMSTAARWFVKRRNFIIGIIMAGGGLGGLISPPLITWIVYNYGWREAFFYVGLGVLVLVVLASQFLRKSPSEIGLVPYGEESQPVAKARPVGQGLTIKQALLAGRFWILAFVIFSNGFASVTVLVHIVPYAIDLGISPPVAAFLLSVMNVVIPIGSMVMGVAADRIGSGKVFIIGVCFLTSILLLLLPVKLPLILGLFLVILSFGSGGVAVMQSSLVADLFGMKSHGAILGCLVFTLSLGGASGTFIAGSIFDSTGSYQLVFAICGGLVLGVCPTNK